MIRLALRAIYAGVGLSVTVVIAATLGKLVFGETGAGIAAAFLSGLPPAMLMARTLWKRSTNKWRERLLHLMDAMAREAEAAAEGRGGERRVQDKFSNPSELLDGSAGAEDG